MTAVLTWAWRIVAAVLLLPMAGRAAAAGQWIAAGAVLALLIIICNSGKDDGAG